MPTHQSPVENATFFFAPTSLLLFAKHHGCTYSTEELMVVGMEGVPQEIFESILDFVWEETYSRDLLPYVTVSRQWQKTIERSTFENLHVKNTELAIFWEPFPRQPSASKDFFEGTPFDYHSSCRWRPWNTLQWAQLSRLLTMSTRNKNPRIIIE